MYVISVFTIVSGERWLDSNKKNDYNVMVEKCDNIVFFLQILHKLSKNKKEKASVHDDE